MDSWDVDGYQKGMSPIAWTGQLAGNKEAVDLEKTKGLMGKAV